MNRSCLRLFFVILSVSLMAFASYSCRRHEIEPLVVPVTVVNLDKSSLVLTEGQTETLSVTLLPSNATDKLVSWSSHGGGAATVDNTGKVTAVRPGNSTIIVSTHDGGKVAACEVTVVQKTIPIEKVSLDHSELELVEGDDHAFLKVTVEPDNASDKKIFWDSSDYAVAVVTGSGHVLALRPGSATITVSSRDGNIRDSCIVTVTERIIHVESVAISDPSLELVEGEKGILKAVVGPENAADTTVVWSSSDETVAVVDSFGNVTALKPGLATITVTTVDGDKTASCEVSVSPRIIPVEYVSISDTLVMLLPSQDTVLVATVFPEDATDKTVEWTSSDETVAVVDSLGKVTAVSTGIAEIVVKTRDGGFEATCVVIVELPVVPVSEVSLDRSSVTIYVGETISLKAYIKPGNATNKEVSWHSGARSIARVDNEGNVTGVKAGTTLVTATTADGKISSSCRVKVIPQDAETIGVRLDKTSMTMVVGEEQKLTATVSPSNATDKRVTWSVDGNAVSVSDGKVKALEVGESTVTVTTVNGGKTASCKVEVIERVPVISVSVYPFVKLGVSVGSKFKLTAIITPDNATDKSVIWKSSKESVAVVDSEGNVTVVGDGVVTITVTTRDGGHSANFYMSCS